MDHRRTLISGAVSIAILLLLLLSSCARQYTKIPRKFSMSQTKTKHTFPTGHFVEYPKTKVQYTIPVIAKRNQDSLCHHINKPHITSNHVKATAIYTQLQDSRIEVGDMNRIETEPVDSITKYHPPKNLQVGAITLFTLFAGSNVVYLIAPSVGFLFIGFLIGVGLLTIGFILSKFISNAKMNRIIPEKIRLKGYRSNSSLRKAFKILMLLSGVFFAIALISLGLFMYELSFVMAVLGLTCLYAGLLVGLIYLATSF